MLLPSPPPPTSPSECHHLLVTRNMPYAVVTLQQTYRKLTRNLINIGKEGNH